MTCLRNMLANSGMSVDFRQGVKCDIFVNQSTKTRTESKPFDGGKSAKSHETDFQGPEGTGSGDNGELFHGSIGRRWKRRI